MKVSDLMTTEVVKVKETDPIARVRRIREIQVGVVAFIGTAAAAALLAGGNVIGRVYNQLMIADGRLAAIVAGAVVIGLLLCCLLVGGVCYTCRPRRR